ncbi:MAG: A24 family peptidase [Eubacteriales bacterium]|nr:A24 family peptidase [Eubacteriales bacterium]
MKEKEMEESLVMIWGTTALACLTGVSAATDLLKGKIYNAVTVTGLLFGVGFSLQRGGAAGLLEVLCAVAFTVMALWPFYRAGGLGAGDIKLLAAVSSFMTSEEYLRCFAGAFVIGACLGLVRLAGTGGKQHKVHFAVPVAASVFLHMAGVF